jgi:hypothetical protein
MFLSLDEFETLQRGFRYAEACERDKKMLAAEMKPYRTERQKKNKQRKKAKKRNR